MSFHARFLVLIALSTVFISFSDAQVPQVDRDDTQFWNDLLVSLPVHKRIDFLFQTTARFGKNLSNFTEGRVGAGLMFKLTKSVSVLPSYHYIETRNALGSLRTEHRFSLRGIYKFPMKKFDLSHRSTFEYRVRTVGNSWRYRPSLVFEKTIPERLLRGAKFFITEEPFYVSTTGKFSRNRISAGVSKTLNEHLTLELYYLRQNDRFSLPGDLHVIGTTWKVKL